MDAAVLVALLAALAVLERLEEPVGREGIARPTAVRGLRAHAPAAASATATTPSGSPSWSPASPSPPAWSAVSWRATSTAP